MGRKKVETGKKVLPHSIGLSPELKAKAEKAAQEKGTYLAAFVRYCLIKELKRIERNKYRQSQTDNPQDDE